MPRFYCVVFVYVIGVSRAQFHGFDASVYKQQNLWNDVKEKATTDAIAKAKAKIEIEETRGKVQHLQELFDQQEKQAITTRKQMQMEINDTRGRAQLLEDMLKQQEKQLMSTKGELLVHSKETRDEVKNLTDRLVQKEKQLMEIQEEMQEVNQKLTTTTENLRKQCLLTDQWQYLISQRQSDGGNRKPTFMSATSSSNANGGVASKAIDGNADAMFDHGSCTHTVETEPSPWWQGRLSALSEVHNITLTNRGDCCASRLKNLTIEGFEENPIDNSEAGPKLCKTHLDQVQGTETITCDRPIVARFIKISLGDNDPLTLCEVTIGGVILSRKGVAVQSSVESFSTNANMATDDDVTTCSVTGRETGDTWWQMDLNGTFTVSGVKITNRNDDKYTWLSNIRIDLYDDQPLSCSNDAEVITPKRCTSRDEQVGQGEAVTLTCDQPQTGSYLRITKNVTIPGEVLSLCDVMVLLSQ